VVQIQGEGEALVVAQRGQGASIHER